MHLFYLERAGVFTWRLYNSGYAVHYSDRQQSEGDSTCGHALVDCPHLICANLCHLLCSTCLDIDTLECSLHTVPSVVAKRVPMWVCSAVHLVGPAVVHSGSFTL